MLRTMISLSIVSTLFTSNLFAQENSRYYYNPSPDCFVKKYKNNELTIVPDKIFSRIELIVQKLKRNPKHKAFKYDGDLYLTPAKCVTSTDMSDLNNLDEVLNETRESKNQLSEKEFSDTQRYNSPSRVSPSFKIKDYYIAISGGKNFVSSQENIYPWLTALPIGYTFDTGESIVTNTPQKSKYNTELIKQFEFGYRSRNSYVNLRFRNFNANKDDNALITLSDGRSGIETIKVKDSISNYYVGLKYLFNEKEVFQPFINGLLGITILNSTLDAGDPKVELSNTSVAAIAETGAELHLSDHFALNLAFGYELLTHKTLRLKDNNSATGLSDNGFKTSMNYSNLYSSMGVIFYW